MRQTGILVMISYDIDIGFAIGRLISVFHDMALRLTGAPEHVHFSFGKVGGGRSAALPASFQNLLEFDYRRPGSADLDRFAEYLRKHRIAVIFALDLPVSSACLRTARQAGVRKVVSYWGAPMSSANRGLKLMLKRIEVALLHRAKPDHFIFESQAMRELAVRGRGLPAASTSVVHTGVDTEKFQPCGTHDNVVYQRFSIPRERRIVVYMGHLHRRKGVHVLMEAAEYLVGTLGRRDIHCLFLGNREHEAEQFRNCFDQAAAYLTFGGYQSDIPALVSGCYVGCIPSTGWDSFPMSSLEMQACGLPVIVSDLQGVPETVADGESGMVVPVGSAELLAKAIAALVDDPDRRERMSQTARRRIESRFTREHQVANLVANLRERTSDA